MKRKRALGLHILFVLLAIAAAGLLACKKEGAGSGVAALLPKDKAAALSKQALAFYELVPEGVPAFGYVDFDQSIDSAIKAQPQLFRDLYADFSEMVQRRFGLALGGVTGAGFVFVGEDDAVFVLPAPAGGKLPTLPAGEVKAALFGGAMLLGEPKQVDAFLAANKQKKPLYKANPGWLRRALAAGAGADAAMYFDADAMRAAQGPRAKPPTDAIEKNLKDAVIVADGTTLSMVLGCKPKTGGEVRARFDQLLAEGRAGVGKLIAELPSDGPGPLAAAMIRIYSEAFFGSVKLSNQGDDVTAKLAFRMPELPKLAKTPALSQRLIAPNEWAVAQLHFGAPMIDLLVALSDLFEVRIDRAAVTRQLVEALGAAVGIPGLNPTGVTVSAGDESILASVHTPTSGLAAEPFSLLGGQLAAVAQPWGVALTLGNEAAALPLALQTQAPPLPLLATTKLAAEEQAIFRAFVDVTNIPPGLAPPMPLPVQSIAMVLTETTFTLEATAQPGRVKELTTPLAQLVAGLSQQMNGKYQNRQNANAEQEAEAILAYHFTKMAVSMLSPQVEGDVLRFSTSFPKMQLPLLAGAATTGVLAAIAIPAFTRYQQASQRALDLVPSPDEPPPPIPAP